MQAKEGTYTKKQTNLINQKRPGVLK